MNTVIKSKTPALQLKIHTTPEFERKYKEGKITVPIKKRIILDGKNDDTIIKEEDEYVKKLLEEKEKRRKLEYNLDPNYRTARKNKIGLELNYFYTDEKQEDDIHCTPEKIKGKRQTLNVKNLSIKTEKKYKNNFDPSHLEQSIKKALGRKEIVVDESEYISEEKPKRERYFSKSFLDFKNYFKFSDFALTFTKQEVFVNDFKKINVAYPINKNFKDELKKFEYIFREKDLIGYEDYRIKSNEYFESNNLPLDEKRMIKLKFLKELWNY